MFAPIDHEPIDDAEDEETPEERQLREESEVLKKRLEEIASKAAAEKAKKAEKRRLAEKKKAEEAEQARKKAEAEEEQRKRDDEERARNIQKTRKNLGLITGPSDGPEIQEVDLMCIPCVKAHTTCTWNGTGKSKSCDACRKRKSGCFMFGSGPKEVRKRPRPVSNASIPEGKGKKKARAGSTTASYTSTAAYGEAEGAVEVDGQPWVAAANNLVNVGYDIFRHLEKERAERVRRDQETYAWRERIFDALRELPEAFARAMRQELEGNEQEDDAKKEKHADPSA